MSDATSLGVTVTPTAAGATVCLDGELDHLSCDQAQERLEELIAQGCSQLVIDLSKVDFVDSTGLSVFVVVHKKLQALGGRLSIQHPRPNVAQVLDVTGLARILVDGSSDTGDAEQAR
jgi:anti-sigma B factor antagonist